MQEIASKERGETERWRGKKYSRTETLSHCNALTRTGLTSLPPVGLQHEVVGCVEHLTVAAKQTRGGKRRRKHCKPGRIPSVSPQSTRTGWDEAPAGRRPRFLAA